MPQADFHIVDRVECPTCHQRQFVADDCICCGGIGFVDADHIEPIIAETLFDLQSGKARASKHSWLPVGLYPLNNGEWYMIDRLRTTRQISQDEANAILFVDEPYWVDSLMTRIESIASTLFSRIYSLIRKPVL